MRRILCAVLGAILVLPVVARPICAAALQAELVFACKAENDLYRVVTAGGAKHPRYDSPAEAVRAAPDGAGVLLLADGYPDKPTEVAPEVFAEAARKKLRLYVEYPASLPDLPAGQPVDAKLERGVVTSEIFGAALRPMRIVTISGCRYVPVRVENPHVVLAKVAGVDTAVFGLQGTAAVPVLFDHPRGGLLVATTKLSHFVTGRYMPQEAWRTIWQTILGRLQPGAAVGPLAWTPTVRPTYGRDEPLPADAERQALRRSAEWIAVRSRILRHPAWPKQALDWALRYNTVREMPDARWPLGDGSLGMLEGFSSTIRRDGSQPMRYGVRNDCLSEVAMLMALSASVEARPQDGRVAANLLDYVFSKSVLAQGRRADPASPSYGLVGWALDSPDAYWGDDNARALLGVLAASAVQKDHRWDDAVTRCIVANFRTTGPSGYREACIGDAALQQRGWKSYWQGRYGQYSPHFEAWLWACFFWAYDKTRFEPFLTRSETGLRSLMAAYPDHWQWCLRSGGIERARILLPLAWLVRVQDTPEHRAWLRKVAGDLVALQDSSGAIREVIGDGGHGTISNAAFGTGEASLIQTDGDPVSDSLYTCNFALIGLHEAAAATGDPFYTRAEDKLARFLCRIQVRSEAHPELDGAWYRAFDFRRWEYWASNADWEWGPWCTETGWTQPWIAGTLALRQMKTSLWDLTGQAQISRDFARLRREMLPDEALKVPDAPTLRHAAVGKPIRLATPADPRYPGVGPSELADGRLGDPDYHGAGWLGFEGKDLDATIDLGAATEIREVGARFLQSPGVAIYLPSRVEVNVSDDGREFRSVATIKAAEGPKGAEPFLGTLKAATPGVRARYVRVRAVGLGVVPAGRPAAGAKAWLFVDEVLVNPAEAAAKP
jgi:hypothetical protein